MSQLPFQPDFIADLSPEIIRALRWMWEEIARAHNASVQPRFVEDTGNPPTVPPEMEQYELIYLSCPNWGAGGRSYLVYYDGTDRIYFLSTIATGPPNLNVI